MDAEAAKTKAMEAAEKAKEEAMKAFATAKEMGFFSGFKDYLYELIVPWALLQKNQAFMDAEGAKAKALVFAEGAKAEIIGTFTLQRGPDVKSTFILYNVLGFWLGIAESLIFAFLGHGLFSLVWNGAVAFAVAYTLYWTMTCAKVKAFMFYSLIFIALYIGFNIYMGISKLVYVLPAILYFGKALCDALMILNGYHLYKDILGPEESFML